MTYVGDASVVGPFTDDRVLAAPEKATGRRGNALQELRALQEFVDATVTRHRSRSRTPPRPQQRGQSHNVNNIGSSGAGKGTGKFFKGQRRIKVGRHRSRSRTPPPRPQHRCHNINNIGSRSTGKGTGFKGQRRIKAESQTPALWAAVEVNNVQEVKRIVCFVRIVFTLVSDMRLSTPPPHRFSNFHACSIPVCLEIPEQCCFLYFKSCWSFWHSQCHTVT